MSIKAIKESQFLKYYFSSWSRHGSHPGYRYPITRNNLALLLAPGYDFTNQTKSIKPNEDEPD